MSGNNLYDPDQAAVDTRWVQPWSEAFRVSLIVRRWPCGIRMRGLEIPPSTVRLSRTHAMCCSCLYEL